MEFLSRCLLEDGWLENVAHQIRIKDYFASFELRLDPIIVPYGKFKQFGDEAKVKNTLRNNENLISSILLPIVEPFPSENLKLFFTRS
jgi:hypothetical protein